jgi:hypothetical protein
MRQFLFSASVLVALAAAVGSCGPIVPRPDGGSADGGASDGGRDGGVDGGNLDAGLTASAACTVLNSKRCEYLRQCGLIAADDDATRDCILWLTATWCGPSLWPARVIPSVGTLKYDGVQAQACAEGFVGRACSDYESLPVACSRFLAPNAYTRQSCYDGYQECTEGVCRGAACPRTCQPRGAEGEVCRLSTDCRSGLYCRISNTAAGIGLCTAFGTLDAGCDNEQPCGPTMACISGQCQFPPRVNAPCPALVCETQAWCNSTPDGGYCFPRGDQGDTCSDDVQCLDGLLCDAVRSTCEPKVLSTAGALCGTRQSCPTATACIGATSSSLGTCGVPRVEGEPCAVSSECTAHLACRRANDGGYVCGARAQSGQSCAFDRDCRVLSRCRLGTCVDLPGTGESCAEAQACLWGPCATVADAGSICVERYGPGALCQGDSDCASEKCVAGRCLAACAP